MIYENRSIENINSKLASDDQSLKKCHKLAPSFEHEDIPIPILSGKNSLYSFYLKSPNNFLILQVLIVTNYGKHWYSPAKRIGNKCWAQIYKIIKSLERNGWKKASATNGWLKKGFLKNFFTQIYKIIRSLERNGWKKDSSKNGNGWLKKGFIKNFLRFL